jgi:hypothetical protein
MPNIASLGFVGYVQFLGVTAVNNMVRATSADLKVTQNIDAPNVVDGKVDRTVYQLGPKEVGGTIAFPANHEDGSSITEGLWKLAVERLANSGRLQTLTAVNIRYTNGTIFKYTDCIVDTFEFSVAQSDVVNISVGLIGKYRTGGDDLTPVYGLRNTRVVTWNDAVVQLSGGVTVSGDEVRTFSANINNNSQRYYTLNGLLFVADIAPTKRDISGNLVIMGRNLSLGSRAESNEQRCTETSVLKFGYQLGKGSTSSGCTGDFLVQFPGVVFSIEEMAITNELFETTVNYKVLPGIAYGGGSNMENFLI